MKKTTSLLLLCLLMISCKNVSEKDKEMAENETTVNIETAPAYKLSIAQWSYHVPIQKGLMDPMDFAERAKALGFETIEYVDQLYTIDSSLSYQEAVMKLALEWKKKNDSFGVKSGLIMIDRAGELADPSEEKRKEAVQMHKYWVDAAAAIGSPALRINLFGLTEPKAWHTACVSSLKELGTYAAEKNIKILSENHAQLSNNPELMVSVMKEVNLSSVGTLPDFGNFCIMREGGARWGPAPCIEEYDRYKGIAHLLPFAGGVSAKSYDFDENGDEKKIDYYKMMQILKNGNFSGTIGIEFENDEKLDPSEGILATKALIEKAYNLAK